MNMVNGLPAHVLLIHFVVVFVPLTGLALVASAIWPGVARRLGVALPLVALATLTSVPLTTHAGEWLEAHVDSDPLVRRHAELGDTLLPWVTGLFVVAVAVWWVARRAAASPAAQGGFPWSATWVRIAAVVLSVGVAAGAVVDVYRIGDSGAKAAWHDGFSQTAGHGDDAGH